MNSCCRQRCDARARINYNNIYLKNVNNNTTKPSLWNSNDFARSKSKRKKKKIVHLYYTLLLFLYFVIFSCVIIFMIIIDVLFVLQKKKKRIYLKRKIELKTQQLPFLSNIIFNSPVKRIINVQGTLRDIYLVTSTYLKPDRILYS